MFLSSRLKNEAWYIGYCTEGKENNDSVFLYPDGSKYEGFWISDLRSGSGTYTYPNGDTYEGDWIQGRRHGQRVYTFIQSNWLALRWEMVPRQNAR